MSRNSQLIPYAGLMLASSFVWILAGYLGYLDGVDQEALRWRYLARGEIRSNSDVVYVNLDAETVSLMGDRPWDRRYFGRVLAALLGPGEARTVSLDIILSKFGAGTLLDLERARKGDHFLGQQVSRYADRVVLAAGYTGVMSSISGDKAELPLIREKNYDPETNSFPEAPTYPIVDFNVGRLALANVDEGLSRGVVPYFVPAFTELSGPRYSYHLMDGMRHYYTQIYNKELMPEIIDDRVRMVVDEGWIEKDLPFKTEQTLFSLGLETYLTANQISHDAVTVTDRSLTIQTAANGKVSIPLVKSQSIEVNWLEGWHADEGVSMREILIYANALWEAEQAGDETAKEECLNWFRQFKDKVIFVGPVDPQLKDIAPTPFNRSAVPKVALHANLYRAIDEAAFMRRLGPVASISCLIVLTFVVSLLAVGSRWARFGSICVLGGYIATVFLVFISMNWVLPLVAPVGSAVMSVLSVVLLKVGSEEWQRRRIKTLFGAYVSPSLVDEMVDSRRDPELGGTEAEVTALFSDVEGFSALSEELSPRELITLMNEYLSAMTETFQAQQGTLDKYIGDAIVTMFGMPYPVKDHAARACYSAIEMQERHSGLRMRWAEEGRWPEKVLKMRTRIGINTGEAIIGNMGSEMRFNYTMMGDSVNLAARCESGAKSYGVYTMITEATLKAALEEGAALNYRKLDRIVVKGRTQPVEIYELWDSSVDEADIETCREKYESALADYFEGNWASALKGFEVAVESEPGRHFAPTTPSAVMATRCREFVNDGTPQGWDGAYRMQTK